VIKIAFVDIETTGFSPINHEIIEFGAIQAYIDGSLLIATKSYHRIVDPTRPVDPFVKSINGYSENDWNGPLSNIKVSLSDALEGVFGIMAGAWHAGSNPIFDADFLKVSADRLHWDYPKTSSYHLIDVTMLAFPLLIKGEVENLKQHNLSKYYNFGDCKHRALDDAEQCMKLFAKINELELITDAVAKL
jgi:DNA polymerase III epsilon subunit-like protein